MSEPEDDDETPVRECGFCGEDCIGRDYVQLGRNRWFLRGEPDYQLYLEKSHEAPYEDEEGTVDDYVHRECLMNYAEGMFIRLEQSAKEDA